MPDDVEKQLESPKEPGTEPGESILDEIKSGMSDLVKNAREHVQRLKDGGKSGITGQFDKPVIVGLDSPIGKKAPASEPRERQQTGHEANADESALIGQASLDASLGVGGGRRGAGVTDGTALVETSESTILANPPSKAPEATDIASASPYGSAYAGEGLTRAIEPGTAVVQKLEGVDDQGNDINRTQTVEELVQGHLLGKQVNLDEKELQKYVREVVEINNVPASKGLPEGQALLLPGHNKSGDLIVLEHDGVQRTVSRDGTVSVDFPGRGNAFEFQPDQDGGYTTRSFDGDGRTHVVERMPDGEGGYVEQHDVLSPGGFEDNCSYEITRTPDGRYEISEEGGAPWDKTEYDPDDPDPRIERARLSDLAQESMADQQDLQKFQQNMEDFERRAREQNLTAQEKARFYHEVTRLMEAGDSNNPDLPNGADRVHIAEQIMSHAANPQLIDQGQHNTCGVASLQSQMFTRNPTVAARLIVDVATEGGFQTTSGRTIELHPTLLKADSESKVHPPHDNTRSYASQLFQAAAISSEYSSFRLQAQPRKPGELLEVADRSETLEKHPDMNFKSDAAVVKFPGLSADEIERINSEIAGDANPLSLIKHASAPPEGFGLNVSDERDLAGKLKALSDGGKLPALIYVDAGNEPFLADSLGGVAGGSGAGHWVTVTAFNETAGEVAIDNQWGSGFDRPNMPLAELYAATKPVSKQST